jgi:SAM-dependent methyltransferase
MSSLANKMPVYDESMIRENARRRLAGTSLLGIVAKQAFSEKILLRVLKGVNFRYNENSLATRAYRAMTINEFEGINARQQWANWRTIPRNLSGRLPEDPIFALDLCCGVGHSTEVLACYLPPRSSILGLEFNPDFVAQAQARSEKYQSFDGTPAHTSFVAQSVLETFRDAAGNELASGSVDLVNCCGAVGVHFKPDATRVLAAEVARVLRVGGLATIDSGPYGTSTDDLVSIFGELGLKKVNSVRSCFLDYSRQVCFEKQS